MVGAFRATGCAVITVSMFDGSHSPMVPEPLRAPLGVRLRQLSDLTKRVAVDFDTMHVDLSEHPAAYENIYSSDGRHGNRRGHAISATETVRRLGAYLGNAVSAHIMSLGG